MLGTIPLLPQRAGARPRGALEAVGVVARKELEAAKHQRQKEYIDLYVVHSLFDGIVAISGKSENESFVCGF